MKNHYQWLMREGFGEEIAEKEIKEFIKEKTKAKDGKVVIGISGGVDSALVAYLAVDALGRENVYGLLLPSTSNTEKDMEDSLTVCRKLGIEYKATSIDDEVESIAKKRGIADKLHKGNIKARVRMTHLRAEANKREAHVIGTGNKSEIMMGYFTKDGDSGVDLQPIGDLYKTEVRRLAKYVGVPERIIRKPASGGLWPGQTDEDEMGINYEKLDLILLAMEERSFGHENSEIRMSWAINISKTLREDIETVKKVIEKVNRSEHKRKMPSICKVRVPYREVKR